MGGSFNPPTIAHLRLMQAALDSMNASQGIFVPTSHEYVLRKMKKLHCPQDTLSDKLRVEMLETFCERDKRLKVDTFKMIYTERKYDFYMIEEIRKSNPDSELYSIIGSDKLSIISRWHRIDEFIKMCRILIAERGEDINALKNSNPYLIEHWDAFRVFNIPEDITGISSSLFRERLRNNDPSAQDLVTSEVWEILNTNGKVPANSITDFHGDYDFLSNFYEVSVQYQGLTYGSSEAAFQAQKCMTDKAKAVFTEYRPGKSKSAGRRVTLRPDWENVKVNIMQEILRAKFTQNSELAERLIDTGDKVLVEGNNWGDTFWGVDNRTGQGENHLGKILMKIRSEIRK